MNSATPVAAVSLGWCGPREADEIEPAGLRHWLHPEELAELEGISGEKRRRDRLAGRLAAKRALCARFADGWGWLAEPADLQIVNDELGRPRLRLPKGAPAPAPSFSLSHSASGAVAAAAEPGVLVGVDLEEIVPRPKAVLAFAAAPDELTPALLSDPRAQARLWTGKEAVLKLLGLGLDADPRMIEIASDGGVALCGSPDEAWRAIGRPVLRVEYVDAGTALAAVARTHG